MIKSLFSGVTGLKTHNQRMDVIGNNIANVNTTAFKAGTVTFRDVYYQTRQRAGSGDFTQGGVNPMQVGFGVQLGTISKVMTQSGLTYSDNALDMALEGSGFFQVMDPMGNIFYTRLGRFTIDNFGNLADANGNIVLGVSGDPTNVAAARQRINIQIPDIEDAQSYALEEYLGHEMTIRAGGIGPGGNIAITVIPSDTSFAEMQGSALKVFMDLTVDYESMAIWGRGTAPGAPGASPLPVPPATLNPGGGIGSRPHSAVPPGTLTPAQMADQAQWDQRLVERISQLFSEDLQNAIRLGGVNVDSAILAFNPDGSINTENSINIEFSSVPDVTAPQNAHNHLQVSNTHQLRFEVRNAGNFGNRYEINVETHGSTGILTQWSGDVLTIRLPSNGDYTVQQIQDAVDNAARGRENLNINVTAQTLLAPNVNLAMTTNLNTPVGTPPVNPVSAYIAGRTLPLGMSNGSDSFFQSAFQNLSTVRLMGGAFRTSQDPSTVDIEVGRDGVIYAYHPVHKELMLGRIDIVDFVNPEGLMQVGTSYFTETMASGPPQVKIAGEESATLVLQGALEMSNVDLSNEFSDMIITQRGFQANSRIITVSDSMLEELVNLKR
jgi:flagellar hook protein FlgE